MGGLPKLEVKDFVAAISLIVTMAVSIGGSAYTYGALTTRVMLLESNADTTLAPRVRALELRTDFTSDISAIKVTLGHLDKQLDRIEAKVDH